MPGRITIPVGAVRDERRLVDVVRGLLNGWSNSIGNFTLTPPATNIVINDNRVGENSLITIMPLDSNARGVAYNVVPAEKKFDFIVGATPAGPALFRYEIRG